MSRRRQSKPGMVAQAPSRALVCHACGVMIQDDNRSSRYAIKVPDSKAEEEVATCPDKNQETEEKKENKHGSEKQLLDDKLAECPTQDAAQLHAKHYWV